MGWAATNLFFKRRMKYKWQKKRPKYIVTPQQKEKRKIMLRVGVISGLLLVVLGIAVTAVLILNSGLSEPEINGSIITVRKGGDFQAALTRAKPGDTILLEAGAKFIGSFRLPKKTGDQIITIQSTEFAKLPAEGVRVAPEQAVLMPKLLSAGKDAPVVSTEPGAHHFRFVGVEFSVTSPQDSVWKLINIGSDEQTQIAQVPHHITFDRCYIHAHPNQSTGQVRSGVSINGSNIEIVNSYISDFRLKDDEGHGIVAWNAPGPFRIVNNYIEASGINVLFGGAFAHPGMNPADLEFRQNHVAKRPEWRGQYVAKNLFELKDMRRAVVEGNVFEHNWTSGQDGTAILFTPLSSQSGENARVEDVQFRSNIVRRSGNGLLIIGTDYGDKRQPNIPSQNNRLRIENNLFTEIGGKWGDTGHFIIMASGKGPNDLSINHNTVLNDGNTITFDACPCLNFVFTNNLMAHNSYGIIGSGSGVGLPSLQKNASRMVFKRNVLAGGNARDYPNDNFFPVSLNQAQFTNDAQFNYRLKETSPFKRKGTDGKDIGCDFEQLEAAIKNTVIR